MSATTWFRGNLAKLLYQLGITAPKRRGRGCLSIVTFHRVLPAAERNEYPYPGLVVTPGELNSFLGYFTENYDCGSLARQHERFLGGEESRLPLLAITFDDAPYDNYRYARPVLARHGITASFFVPVLAVKGQEPLWHDKLGFSLLALLREGAGQHERVQKLLASAGLSVSRSSSFIDDAVQGSKRLGLDARLALIDVIASVASNQQIPDFARPMNFSELAELVVDGHEIGSHSMSHCLMPECDDGQLVYELEESRRVLQSQLGGNIDSFCYPNGNVDYRTAAAVARAGYRRAVTTKWGLNREGADVFKLRRCDMDPNRVRNSGGMLMPSVIAFRMSGFNPRLW